MKCNIRRKKNREARKIIMTKIDKNYRNEGKKKDFCPEKINAKK
jgi:hypothetical protein